MKTGTKLLIGFSLAILVICLAFFLNYILHLQEGSGEYVIAYKLQDVPEKYVELSSADLEKYPYVKQAIMNPGNEVKIPSDRYKEASEFMKKLIETNYVKVSNEYYEIRFIA